MVIKHIYMSEFTYVTIQLQTVLMNKYLRSPYGHRLKGGTTT
jgi:hypothetical protein